MPAVYGLIDDNSFYCSAERAFAPTLRTQPLVVLSNNDGCAIARTAEAKALAIKMGDPWHHLRQGTNLSAIIRTGGRDVQRQQMVQRVDR
ncbi:Y-family DNA polymerase [Roseomonas haemaphysalidis]|uniref:Y-family DNA polymerase n=1 Tax=Roseomonas haemaphysalidis TaxID=2768162 RepID=UPI0038D115DB